MALRSAVVLALAAAALAGDEPEPGLVPPDDVTVAELAVRPQKGDAQAALAAFLDAHRRHRQKDVPGALAGYLVFLGMPGHLELPRRYRATARERVEKMRKEARVEYEKATALYTKDRVRGLAALGKLVQRFAALPEGRAARALVHSDAIRAAIADARARAVKGKKKEAAAALEKAVRRYTDAVYRYEAKSLLQELGGPDLFEKGERIETDEDDDEEIEVSDG